jgi:BASS family bile acid:Na+ symporter
LYRPSPILLLTSRKPLITVPHSVGMDPRRILGSSAIMMTLSFITAMAMGGFPKDTILNNSDIATISLVVMMSVSLANLKLRELRLATHSSAILRAFFLSAVLSSGSTMLLAFLFQGDLRAGWIMVAAAPSAVSLVAFTYLMKGDLEPTLVSTAALYLIALMFTPLITLVFLGESVDPVVLLTYIGLMILLPMFISRPLRRLNVRPESRTIMVNLSLFVLIVAVAGPNREIFFHEWGILAGLLAVAVFKIFGIGLLWDRYLRFRHVSRERRVPEVLFATHKNNGMAATMAIALVGPEAAVPATVCVVIDIIWLISLSNFIFKDGERRTLRGLRDSRSRRQ